jgi:hypothetical protein
LEPTVAVNGAVSLAWNTRLFLDTVIQANTVEETGRALARLRWRYQPGSDLFIVYREDFEDGWRLHSSERQINLKLTYWYDTAL